MWYKLVLTDIKRSFEIVAHLPPPSPFSLSSTKILNSLKMKQKISSIEVKEIVISYDAEVF